MCSSLRGRAVTGALFILIFVGCGVFTLPVHGADRAELAGAYDTQMVPFLKTYCLDCHAGDTAEAELDFEKYRSLDDVTTIGRKKWNGVHEMLVDGSMPPEDSAQPSEEELRAALSWIEDALASIDCNGPVNPGRETIRRLNRTEYENTIRDLVGIDYQATEILPADDVGYGFR